MKREFNIRGDKNVRVGVKGAVTWFALAVACLIVAGEFLVSYPIWNNAFHLFSGLFLGGMCASIAVLRLYLDGKLHFDESSEEEMRQGRERK